MFITARRALFLVLIVLTAFRGMVGDAMAYGMTGQAIAIDSIAISVDSIKANEHFEHKNSPPMPCHEDATGPTAQTSESTLEPVCGTCQVCHLSVTLPFSAISHLPILPKADKPSLSTTAWVNADLRLLSKPPLS